MTSLRTLSCALTSLWVLSGPLAAQSVDDPPQIVVGPMAGIALSTLRGAGVDDADVRTGVIAGGFATFSFTAYFAFQPQVVYVQKGANFKRDAVPGSPTGALALSYIEIPLLFQARYPIGTGAWPLTVSAIAGPSIAIKVNCKDTIVEGQATDCDRTPSTDTQLEPVKISSLDFSAVFGVGLDFWHFAFQAKYDYSFQSIYTYPNSAYPYQVDIKNQAWELTLGYQIKIH